jgi:hypothetical protein
VLTKLIEESRRGVSLVESPLAPGVEFTPPDVQAAADYVRAHPDHTAYHVLFALRARAPDAYQGLPATTRAAVLCAALGKLRFLNDWGYLAPKDPHDGPAAAALVETGAAALPCLAPLLDNRSDAPLFGSEEATLSSMYKYRRCDFAFRAAARILGAAAPFDADPRRRDKDIAQLKARWPK